MYGYGMFLATNGIVQSGGGLTARTTAFATATGITDVTILNALNTFDLGLISNGLDSKIKVLNPFVGGTSTTNSYNFMNTSQYQLTWYGGWSYNSTGVTPNGTTGYADTGFKPITHGSLTANNNHIGIYSRTSTASNYYNAGSETSPAQNALNIWVRRTDNTSGYDSGTYTANRNVFSNIDGKGYYLGKVNSDLTSKFYKNGVLKNTISITNMSLTDVNIYLGSTNPVNLYTNQEISLFHCGTGLTDTDATNLNTLVQSFITALGR